MKLSTAVALTLGISYGLYALSSLAFATNTTVAMEQCKQDLVRAIQAKERVGKLGQVSDACATTETATLIGRALIR